MSPNCFPVLNGETAGATAVSGSELPLGSVVDSQYTENQKVHKRESRIRCLKTASLGVF